MKRSTPVVVFVVSAMTLGGCGGGSGSPPRPSPVTTTTTTAPSSPFETRTLITVYRNASAFAEWSEGVTRDAAPIGILLGVDELVEGTTILNNEVGRFELQAAIERMLEQFSDADFVSVFDETKENLARFMNDADNDGWAVDGRHGVGRDWPHDSDGNDPDGWTAQVIVVVTRT